MVPMVSDGQPPNLRSTTWFIYGKVSGIDFKSVNGLFPACYENKNELLAAILLVELISCFRYY